MTLEGPHSNKREKHFRFAALSLHKGATPVQTSDEATGFT